MCVLVTVMCLGLLVLEGLHGSAACKQQCVVNCERTMDNPELTTNTCCCDCQSLCCVVNCERTMDNPELTTNTCCCDCQSLCDKLCRLQDRTLNSVDSGESPLSARVLTTDKLKRLLASCRPCRPRAKRKPRSPSLREAALIARSVGLDLGAPEGEVSSGATSSQQAMTDWQPQLTSMSRERYTVKAQLAWEPPPGAGPWYLVTWSPEGGSLSGNLLTNTSSTSLSLGADTLYHVQITVVSTGKTSQCLQVDTHSLAAPRLTAPLTGAESVAGVGAAVLVFILAVLLVASRKSSPAKARDFTHFKLYPPPVTILAASTATTGTPPSSLTLAV